MFGSCDEATVMQCGELELRISGGLGGARVEGSNGATSSRLEMSSQELKMWRSESGGTVLIG